MTVAGQLFKATGSKNTEYKGSISTLLVNITFEARRIPRGPKDKEGAPTHRLYAVNNEGVECEVGAMWEKAATKPEHEGEPFFTLTFTDPSLDKPHNFAAFKQKNGKPGHYDITFRYRTGKPAARAVSSAVTP
jgi:uncharacterized protein (DUF736 family)